MIDTPPGGRPTGHDTPPGGRPTGRHLATILALLCACNAKSPSDDYHAFLGRADRTQPDAAPDAAQPGGHFADLSGNWFLRAMLTAGLDLGLRIRACAKVDRPTEGDWARCDPLTAPGTLMIRLWLEKQHIGTDVPLVETESAVDETGHFILRADPLRLPADLAGSEIVATVIMDAHITAAGTWCGVAGGTVTTPPGLEIDGSTFAATRDPEQTASHFDLPGKCGPEDTLLPDGGVGDAAPPAVDVAVTATDLGVSRPPSPDLSAVTSVAADITGHWLVTAKLPNGLPLQLWLSLVYAGGEAGGTLDGAIHKTRDAPGTPAAATFTTTVTTDGRFEVWLPGFSMRSDLGTLEADILLSGATLGADGFCGLGAGEVHHPIATTLTGATFGATRFVPGTAATPAAQAVAACPSP